jgi:hypothetical protein
MNGHKATTTPQVQAGQMILRLPEAGATITQLMDAIVALLDAAGIEPDARAELLGGAFVTEAVRPYWKEDRSPAEAHALLCGHDPELADAVEALSPMLLGRAQARADAEQAIRVVEEMFG